ncbi:MAG: cupin domain-containing protein [bacterium]
MQQRAAELIATLDLRPHPEGGFYREVFRSESHVVRAGDNAERAGLTTIYFLLPRGTISRLHQVDSDEVWHLYEGGPLELFNVNPAGNTVTRHRLEPLDKGSGAPVCVIPAGHWQAARSLGAYTLVGCTVGPGFEFTDFRMLADNREVAAAVIAACPEMAEFI